MQSSVYDMELVQARLTQLLEKYSSGLWISKVSGVYSQMFNEKLYPQVLIDLEKWTHICMVSHFYLTLTLSSLVISIILALSHLVEVSLSVSRSPTYVAFAGGAPFQHQQS